MRPLSFHGARTFSAEERPTEERKPEIPVDSSEQQLSSQTSTSGTTNVIVFPWRHEATPLPRLIKGTIEYETQGQLLSSVTNKTGHHTMNTMASAFAFLNVPLYQFLFFGTWKAELADSVSWAFTQGVANLLCQILASNAGELYICFRPIRMAAPNSSKQI